MVLVIILISLLLVVVILSTISNSNLKKKLRNEVKKSYEAGLNDGVIKVIQSLDEDPSVLNNVTNWIYDLQNQRKDVFAAKDIFTQLLTRLERTHAVKPIGNLGEMVRYDPTAQRTLDSGLRKGDQVTIIEVGWSVGQKLIRKPMVGKDGR